jgi:DNA invertase Pin-like site-specific DNA recombinase
MKNGLYFAYIRVSTTKQGERGVSLIEQRSAIEAYASQNGLTIGTWFEEMETASKQGRRKFNEMLVALKRGAARGLIVHKIDRSARNWRDWAELADLLDKGTDVRFVSDNLDLRSTGGRLTADLQAAIAAHYSRNLRDEVKKGLYGRLKQGLYPWVAPLGYLDNGGGKPKTIDPIKGPLVRHLFERYATNTVSFEELRQELALKGLRTSNGLPLYPDNLTRVLNNPFYMGVIRVRRTGETFPGIHEPLITKAVFDRVQAILRGKIVSKAKNHRFLFRGLIACSNCKRRTLTGETRKGFTYYRCHSKVCKGVSFRSEVVEKVALDVIRAIRFTDREIREIREHVEEYIRGDADDAERRKASLALNVDRTNDQLTRLTDLLIDGTIDKVEHNERREKLLMTRQALLAALNSTDMVHPLLRAFERFEHDNTALLLYETSLDDEKREMLRIVGSDIVADTKGPIFTPRSPYYEIVNGDQFYECGHYRDEVRTLKAFQALVRYSRSNHLPDVPNLPEPP